MEAVMSNCCCETWMTPGPSEPGPGTLSELLVISGNFASSGLQTTAGPPPETR